MYIENYEVADNSNKVYSSTKANNAAITPKCELSSESEKAVGFYREYFVFKEFTSIQSQVLPRFVLKMRMQRKISPIWTMRKGSCIQGTEVRECYLKSYSC